LDGYAAVVLAGGAGRRMGGRDKTAIGVDGVSMRDRVLAAASDAEPRVVVGGHEAVPEGVVFVREDPPGGGPVAAIEAGVAVLGGGHREVLLVAGDLPLLTPDAVGALRRALPTADGALFVDGQGRRQLLCGVWQVEALRRRLREVAGSRDGRLAGASMRELLGSLQVVEVSWTRAGPPPWFDCDTDDDLRRVREWLSAEKTEVTE